MGRSTEQQIRQVAGYRLLGRLSLGGMAELYLALPEERDGALGPVVLKQILPQARGNASFVRMLLDEARITASLSHPNIAQVYDFGETDLGPYLTMEYVPGRNLNQLAAWSKLRGGTLPVAFTVSVCAEVCDALYYAHTFRDSDGVTSPIIHRDVAQKNVMVTFDGDVKLLDFGIAKARGSLAKTQVGMVKGTTGYMSPEQVRGEALDARSDLFSVGVMLHELLTGRRLFAAATEVEEMEKIVGAPIPWPGELNPDVEDELSDIVLGALARERDARFPNGRALARALRRCLPEEFQVQQARSALMRRAFSSAATSSDGLVRAEDDEARARAAARVIQEAGGLGDAFPEVTVPRALSAELLLPIPRPEELGNPGSSAQSSMSSGVSALDGEEGADGEEFAARKLTLIFLAAVLILALVGLFVGYRVAGMLSGPPERSSPTRVSALAAFEGRTEVVEPVETGLLTLRTRPEVRVQRGDLQLGSTPLIDLPLPVGRHQLALYEESIGHRTLTVEIEAGRRATYRIAADSLPRR